MLVLLIQLATPATAAPTLRLQGPESLLPGQNFSLQLRLDQPFDGLPPGDALLFFGLQLQLNGLHLLGFEPAPGWSDDSPWLGPDVIAASRFPGLVDFGQSSEVLGWLRFEVLQPGAVVVDLAAAAGELSLGLGYWHGGSLAAGARWEGVAVPEPGGVGLLCFALLAAWLGTRRRAGLMARCVTARGVFNPTPRPAFLCLAKETRGKEWR
ncbi:PEP-CTERM sorting domain-containing protein [Inhella proteolytica]|uniref:PEP-CTERM sorting domain-containing protein n=1 Tax=Inhella proteolytica TaxID=2795029 RepID=A0A931J776_9BURK|nr:PEP-CTERM sorting domain-containing protein [Inhella proteolytica]MBH9577612.1 PEP-CTERM sorting domain-containing protein [Inhella proteolytica]